MSLCPSNYIAANANPDKTVFPNLAGSSWEEADKRGLSELQQAGIDAEGPFDFLRVGEVPFGYAGFSYMWSFRRAWYYWVAEGAGIPAEVAEEFHKGWGTQVRVNGDCTCPSPLQSNEGFAIGLYHIDTQEGLNAFVELLKSIHKPARSSSG